jgi:NADH-quinone oxidoreductase subunit E
MHSMERRAPADTFLAFIDPIIARHAGRPGALLGILEAVQEKTPHNYLPSDVLHYVALKTNTPLSRVYSVATFYALFNLEPQGEHTICVCRGTACHTRGSRALLESLELDLGLAGGEKSEEEGKKLSITTPDGKYTVRTVACFGQCALAPVVEIDHRISGHVNERTLQREIKALNGNGSK